MVNKQIRRPSFKILLVWERGFFALSVIALIIVLLLSKYLSGILTILISLWTVLFIIYFLYAYLKYNNYYYIITDEHIMLTEGIIKRKSVLVPYERIQDTMEVRGPIEQLLGLTNLSIATAGTKDYELIIQGLDKKALKELKEVIKEKSEAIKKKDNKETSTYEELYKIRKLLEELLEHTKKKKTTRRKKKKED